MNSLLDSLPSCFTSSNGGRLQKCATKMHQTIVSSVYRATICGSSALITLTWFRTSTGAAHSLIITVDSSFSLTIDLSPPSYVSSLFRKKRGCKTLPISDHHCKLAWDFSKACFADAMAEPASDFYLAVVQDESTVAFLLSGPTSPGPLSRREHMFGRRSFATRARSWRRRRRRRDQDRVLRRCDAGGGGRQGGTRGEEAGVEVPGERADRGGRR